MTAKVVNLTLMIDTALLAFINLQEFVEGNGQALENPPLKMIVRSKGLGLASEEVVTCEGDGFQPPKNY